MRVAGSAMVLGIVILAAPAPSRAQCPPIVQTPEVQTLVDECSAWTEVTYDPSLGYLPDQDPVTPWDVFLDTGATAQIIDDRLVITGPGTPSPTKSFYQRDEPLLSDPNTTIYVVQVGLAVDELTPGLIPELEKYAQVGAGDGTVFPGFNAQLYQSQRLLVFGDFNGSPLDPNSQILPFDFRNDTTYTLAVERGETAYLEVGSEPLLSMPYADFTANPQRIGLSIFVAGNVRAEYRYVQYCMCTSREPPIAGEKGEITISNVTDSPDPFDPEFEDTQLSLNLDVLNMPGASSGQFSFRSRVVWEIRSVDQTYREKTVIAEDPVLQTGNHLRSLLWDGVDAEAFGLPSGTYAYKVRVELIRKKISKGKEKLVDSVESPWLSTTINRSAPQIFPSDGRGRSLDNLEVGSSLHLSADNLQPNSHYEFFVVATDAQTVSLANAFSYARLGTDGDGKILPFVLWYQSGVVGCSERIDPATSPFQFRTLDEASQALAGQRVRISAYPVRIDAAGNPIPPDLARSDPPVATHKLPVVSRSTPLVFASNSDGCMIHSRSAGSEDLYASGRNFPPFTDLQISLVPNQWAWTAGDLIKNVTSEVIQVTTDESGDFDTGVWDAAFQFPGAYDIITHPPPPPPPPGGPDPPPERPEPPRWEIEDILAYPGETGVVLYDIPPQFHVPAVNIAVRNLAASPFCPDVLCTESHYEFSDSFPRHGFTVYGALDPVRIPPNQPAGQYAAVSIVPHRTVSDWNISFGCSTPIDSATFPGPPGNDPSGLAEIVPIKDGWFSSPFPLWHTPLQFGNWDVVADMGQNTPQGFTFNNAFDCGVDFLDGASRPGFVVANDPHERGPLPFECREYRIPDFYLAFAGGATERTVDLAAVACWPASGPDREPPGVHPLFIMQHGFHRVCTELLPSPNPEKLVLTWDDCPDNSKVYSYRGYMELLRVLASHGIIAVSMDIHELNDRPGFPSKAAGNDERGRLFLFQVMWWAHLNDPSAFDGPIPGAMELPDDYFVFIGPLQPVNLNEIMEGHVDMSRVSISGHSRGGEAAIHAVELNTDFDIGSVSAIAPATNEPPPVVLGDIPYFVINAAGDCDAKPWSPSQQYDRVPDTTTKSAIYVHGANHNWFNTAWAADLTDPDGLNGDDCERLGVSERELEIPKAVQQRLGESYLAAFVRLHLNDEIFYEDMLRGRLSFPSTDGIRLFHVYHHEQHLKLEDGASSNVVWDPQNVLIDRPHFSLPTHEFLFNDVLSVRWQHNTDVPYIEYAGPWNLSTMDVLSFRAAWTDFFDWTDPDTHPVAFQLIVAELRSGTQTSSVNAWQFGGFPEPYNYPDDAEFQDSDPFNIMTTIRIPLRAFLMDQAQSVDLSHVDAMRLYFYFPREGELYLDDIEFSK